MDDIMESPRKRQRRDDADAVDKLDFIKPATSTDAQDTGPNEQEQVVGITVFVSQNAPGFRCTIKHRYTDFLVNEILPTGEVLHLKDIRERSQKVSAANGDAPQQLHGGNHSQQTQNENNAPPENAQGWGGDEPISEGARTSRPDKGQQIDQPDQKDSQHDDELNAIAKVEDSNQPASEQDAASEISDVDKAALQGIFGEETAKRILHLYASVVQHPERKPRDQPVVKSEPIMEKSKRTEAHVTVRRIFHQRLLTEMMQDQPGIISIGAAPTKGSSGARGQLRVDPPDGAIQKGKLGWDELGGEFLHFTLYKENKDTMEVLYFIASQLKVPIKNFQFAGTKDRRGVTVQRVAIFRVHSDRVSKLNKTARNWRVGDFEYKKHGLDLGELGGNEFLLTLRNCYFDGEESMVHEQKLGLAKLVVEKAIGAFKETGFLNYYGLQRFGTYSKGTHATGQMMLKGDLEGAIDSILTYSDAFLPENVDTSSMARVPRDDIDRADAIRIWRTTQRSTDAVSKMPRRFQAESAIVQYLGKKNRKTGQYLQERDWQGALMQIQRNLRLMYVHAYQSFVWNTVAGKRWELFGNKVVEGDLIIVGDKDANSGEKKDQVDEDGEPIFHPAEDDSGPSNDDKFTRARALTAHEALSGKYDIFDVVLPLPGYDVLYPANAIGKFYEEFMATEVGGGMNPHNMRRSWKDVSLSGSYRKVMARPGSDLAVEIKTYTDDEEQMIETDLEKMQKQGGVSEDNGVATTNSAETEPPSAQSAGKGEKKIAIVLKMQLGSSQYATMALRELTKGGAVNFKPDYSAR